MRNHVLRLHQAAQNARTKYAQEQAEEGYRLYLKFFSRSKKILEMRFFYAELLYDQKKYKSAAANYMWVANNGPRKGPYHEKALINALLALEKGLPTEAQIAKRRGKSSDPIPFDENTVQFEQAALRYMKDVPKGEKVPDIQFRLAQLYYQHNQFNKAIPEFNAIVRKYPKSKYAEYSANLILDIYNIRKDYVGLEKAGRKLLANPQFARSRVGKQIAPIIQKASFKQCQDQELKKNYIGAGRCYEKYAGRYGKGKLATSARYNSAVNYERAGRLDKAIEYYGVVIGTRGTATRDLRNKSRRLVARLYEQTGQFEKAARAFEQFARENPKDRRAKDFYFNAAVIREGLRQYSLAIRNYNAYFDNKADRVEAVFFIAEIWRKRGNKTRAAQFYEKYVYSNPRSPEKVIEAHFQLAKIYESRRNTKKADQWYRKTIAVQRRLARRNGKIGVQEAAESRFKLALKPYMTFRGVRITGGPRAQERAVKKKLALLNGLNKEFADVIRYDDADQIVSALATLGEAYHHMSDSLYRAPVPKGLSQQELAQYRAGIDKVAAPFKEKAVENYQAAVNKSTELEGYNDFVFVAVRGLNTLKPGAHPDGGEQTGFLGEPDWMGL